MAERQEDKRLMELQQQGANIYSISKLNALDGCLREAYYSYRDINKPKRVQSIYGIMGTEIHEVLENIYKNEATADALLPAMNKELEDADICGVDFPKDFSGGTSIRDNWIADMTHFCKHFEKIEGEKFSTEELVLYKLSDSRYMMGYIDLSVMIDELTKTIDIYDFKTSRKFEKHDLTHYGRQLIFYALAKEAEGYCVRNVAWVMLKYVKISYEGYARVNSQRKTTISKIVQRGKIGREMARQVENTMHEMGYGEIDTEIHISYFKAKNDFDVLPEDVQAKFKVEQYIEYYDFNKETIAETLEYINSRADKFEELWKGGYDAWEPTKIADDNAFYCNNLCSHRDICDEIRKYNTLKTLEKTDENDLF